MGGLLYKDFVSRNKIGKVKITWVIFGVTLLFIILRVVFPGTKELEGFMATNEQGEIINQVDVFFYMFYGLWLIFSLSMISVSKIMGYDEKNKIKEYLSVMPIGKNTYVASKYVFVGIAAYVMMTVDYFWGISCAAFCRAGTNQNVVNMVNSFVVSFICIPLFLAAIEFPLYFSLGKEKAKRVMVVFWTVIAFIVVGFLMFGDLKLIENWDIGVFMAFVEKHKTGILIFQNMWPVIILILYYLSYRFSCYLYHKKEGEN